MLRYSLYQAIFCNTADKWKVIHSHYLSTCKEIQSLTNPVTADLTAIEQLFWREEFNQQTLQCEMRKWLYENTASGQKVANYEVQTVACRYTAYFSSIRGALHHKVYVVLARLTLTFFVNQGCSAN